MSHSNKLNIIIIFAILYLSLIIGFLFGENSSGGAVSDFNLRISIINEFITDFKFAFFKHQSIALKGKAVLILILLNLSSGEAATIFPSIISAADEMCV